MAALAKRLGTVLLATILAVGLAAPAAVAGSYENDALALLNQARASAGLAPVTLRADLSDDALAWSRHMADRQKLSHNPNLSAVAEDWDELGENVGVGTSIASLHEAFMDSAGHRANILGDYDSVGIGVVAENPSKLWITVVFMKTLNATPAGKDDPEPYAAVRSVPSNGQADANPATNPAPPVANTPVAVARVDAVVPPLDRLAVLGLVAQPWRVVGSARRALGVLLQTHHVGGLF
jgi:hypothetical protein